jgi:hypothetical protein
MAASVPVVVASNQSAIPISAASLPLPTGAATLAGQTQPGVDIGDVTVNNAAGAAAVNIQDGGNSITVDGTITATAAGQAADGAAVAGNPVRIGGKDGGGLTQDIITDATGVLAVQDNGGSLTVDSTQLPAALAAGGGLKVEGVVGGVAQPISAASLPLPTGASTLAGQTQPGVDIGDVTINNAAGASAVNIQDGGNSLTVDGSVSITGTPTVDTELPAAAALADATANPTTPLAGAANEVFNGTTWDRMRGTTAGVQVQGAAASGAAKAGNPVQVGGVFNTTQPTVTTGQGVEVQSTARGAQIVATGVDAFTVAGTVAVSTIAGAITPGTAATALGKAEDAASVGGDTGVFALGVRNDAQGATTSADGDYTQISTDPAGNLRIVGNIGPGVADQGTPVGMGLHARTTNPTAVADGQRVAARSDKIGRAAVVPYQVRDLVTQNNITLTTTAETTLIAAGGASIFNDLTTVILSNTSGTAVRVDFRDATAGTVRFSIFLAATGGGAVVAFSCPWKQTTANNNWTAQLSAAVTDVRIAAQAAINI